jgi:hypothetical protein
VQNKNEDRISLCPIVNTTICTTKHVQTNSHARGRNGTNIVAAQRKIQNVNVVEESSVPKTQLAMLHVK